MKPRFDFMQKEERDHEKLEHSLTHQHMVMKWLISGHFKNCSVFCAALQNEELIYPSDIINNSTSVYIKLGDVS